MSRLGRLAGSGRGALLALSLLAALGGGSEACGGSDRVSVDSGPLRGPEAGASEPAKEGEEMSEEGRGMLQAKRVAPPEVAPVTIGDLRFEAVHWGKERGFGQNGGYVAAFDAASGQELWTLEVYQVDYDPEMEADVQDVFIQSMSRSLWGKKLKITDERGRRYVVDPQSRSVKTD